MDRVLVCRPAAAGEEAVLIQIPAEMRHVASVAIQGASVTAFLAAAAAAPVVAARCCAALHSSADDRYQLVSSVVQLLLDTAQDRRHDKTANMSSSGRGAAKHEAGRWPAPGVVIKERIQVKHLRRPRCTESTVGIMSLAHALQAAHAQPPASLADATPYAAMPRKLGPPPLLHRRMPGKRSSTQDLQTSNQPSSGRGARGSVYGGGRSHGKRRKSNSPKMREAQRRPAWAGLAASELAQQEEAMLDFVNSL